MWAGRVAQVIDHLLSKRDALSLNPSTAKKKKKKYRNYLNSSMPCPSVEISTMYFYSYNR
jgi:hypothetical protein